MKDLLRQKSPDLESVVDIALKQERLKDEKKNQKVLLLFLYILINIDLGNVSSKRSSD